MTDIVHDSEQETKTSGLLITEFKTKPNIKGLAEIFGAKIQELEDALFQLFTLRGVDTAFGAQLDLLGAVVGVVRGGLNDTDYATAIRAEILLNVSSGTIQQILALMYTAFPGVVFTGVEEYPADFRIVAHSPLANPAQAGALVHSALPAGVGGYLVYSIVPAGHTFTYCDSNDSQPVIDENLGYGSSTPDLDIVIDPGFSPPFSDSVNILLTNGSVILAAGDGGQAALSYDGGFTWTSTPTGINPALENVSCGAYGAGFFVLGTDIGNTLFSTDAGLTWSALTSVGAGFKAMTYGNGLFVGVTTAGEIFSSPDADTWTSQTNGFGGGIIWSVCWSGSLFVAGGDGGVLETSPDGVTWTDRTSTLSGSITASFFGGGLYLIGDNAFIASSSDGITWNTILAASGADTNGFAYGDGTFMLVWADGTAAYSLDDTATWFLITPPTVGTTLTSIIYLGSFLASGQSNTILTRSGGRYAGSA